MSAVGRALYAAGLLGTTAAAVVFKLLARPARVLELVVLGLCTADIIREAAAVPNKSATKSRSDKFPGHHCKADKKAEASPLQGIAGHHCKVLLA